MEEATNSTKLSVHNISDLILQIDTYVSLMREKKDLSVIPKLLDTYTTAYFEKKKPDETQLRYLAVLLADNIYWFASRMSIFDDYTRMYFSYVLSGLEEAIHLQGVDIAYIIDNQIEEERFALTAVLFSLAGIAVVTPHPIKGEQIVHQSYEKQLGWALAFFPEDIHAADDSTNTNLTLPEIKKQIGAYAKKKRSITYIEKDDSVNYIDQVVKKLAGTHYTAVLRNLPPSDPHLTEIKHGGK